MKTIFTTLATAVALTATSSAGEYYRVSVYQLNSPEKAAAFDKMMAAAIPVLTGAGVGPVGVFKGKRADKDGSPNWRYTIAACDSLDKIAASGKAFAEDEDFLKEAYDYLAAEKSKPAFARINTSTFVAFDGFPKLAKPAAAEGDERFFELRIYESHGEYKAFMKVKMFNEGELDIFKKVGLRGVFFGHALSGDNLPNLTYMLVYDNDAEHKKAWDAFRKDPDWSALKGEEQYADTVSKIDSKFLTALPYSGIK